MKNLARLLALPALCLSASGCVIAVEQPAVAERPVDDFPLIERRFDPGSFAAIELAGSDRVEVAPGSAVSVVARGGPQAVAALDVAVRGDTLRIARRLGNYHDRRVLVRVTVPMVRAASISGSGAMTVAGAEGSIFTASVAGSGSLHVVDLRARTARFDLSGSGSISGTGSADDVAINLGGSGSVDTRGLASGALTVSAGGSGTISATATRVATIRAGGSGSVRVTGGARCNVSKGGSGSVRCG